MSDEIPEGALIDQSGCGPAAVSMAAATVPVAVVITLFGDNYAGLYGFVWFFTFAIVGFFGGIAFSLIHRHLTWTRISGAGFVIGAIVPSLGFFLDLPRDFDPLYLYYVLQFGVLGVAGALFAWLLFWLQSRFAKAMHIIAFLTIASVPALSLLL